MMSDRKHFLDLARISRRVAKNVTNKSIADRLEEIANDYEHEAISDALVKVSISRSSSAEGGDY
jgi:hypothetical protein